MAHKPLLLAVQKTSLEQSKINIAYLNPEVEFNDTDLMLIDSTFLFAAATDPSIPSGSIALSKVQREYLNKALRLGGVEVEFIDRKYFEPISVIKMTVEMVNTFTMEIDAADQRQRIKDVYEDFPFNRAQHLYIEYESESTRAVLLLVVTELITEDRAAYGILGKDTQISLSSASTRISLIKNEILKPNFSFEQLGIGGLKKEFEVMFRRAFVQRRFEPELIKSLGISHVKGIILHGPPGTGKTLIARRLGSLLDSRPPKIVNGPEILDKYVGQSEENIRNLFKEAEEEYKSKKEQSKLHIIIFDEIDAICKKRGLGGSSNIGDQVVTQLLSKIDGVEALNNILLIGMTNRLDLIDDALLRPGRFEIHLEISLPDEESRYEIFAIHTKQMSGNNHLDKGVDLKKLAALSKNYTGAEIEAVVRAAIGYALDRRAHLDNRLGTREAETPQDAAAPPEGAVEEADSPIRVTPDDFFAALQDTRPAFGVDEKEMEMYNKVFYETAASIAAVELGNSMINRLMKTNLYNTNSLLFYGGTGSGKTTLAVRIALQSQFPFIKMISPRQLVGMVEFEKVNRIKECFLAAYKSEYACIILDDLEGLIEFVSIGPRFLNPVLQAIKIFVKAEEKKKMFIFGTTSAPEIMMECGIFDCFGESLEIGPCSRNDYESLCLQNQSFNSVNFTESTVIKKLLALLPDPDTSSK